MPVLVAIDRSLETLAVATATHTRLIELTVREARSAADAEIQRADAAVRAIEASAGEKILAAIGQRVDDVLLRRVRLGERQWLATAGGVLLVITIALCAGAYALGSYQASLGRLMETCRGGEIRKDSCHRSALLCGNAVARPPKPGAITCCFWRITAIAWVVVFRWPKAAHGLPPEPGRSGDACLGPDPCVERGARAGHAARPRRSPAWCNGLCGCVGQEAGPWVVKKK
jgi:hypothetical protein